MITITASGSLNFSLLETLYDKHLQLQFDQTAKDTIQKSAKWVEKIIQRKEPIYGINTGFGKLANVIISNDQLSQLQHNLIVSHAIGMGVPLPAPIVRLITALKLNSLAQGYSGTRLELIDAIAQFHNHEIIPIIPEKGSVGASGDLAPLAHLVLPLLGYGNCIYRDKVITAEEALKILGLRPMQLAPKEGLALINGTQVSTAIALSALILTKRILHAAMLAGCLSLVAVGGGTTSFDPRLQKIRGQTKQIEAPDFYRELLKGCDYEKSKSRVQDPYSLRCQPQVMGSCWAHYDFVASILKEEINGVTDNPVLFEEDEAILTGGNFHAEPIAMASDVLALVLAEIGSMSERRMAFLTDAQMSGLSAFLINNPGLNSGFMIAHVTAAALVSENKSLAHPASVDSIPTSANQEDHVSMATYAARRLLEMADNAAGVMALELMAACQALDLNRPKKLSPALQSVYELIRGIVPYVENDFYMADALENIKNLIKTRSLANE
ncbi:MAG: histidine ammonia-lyase [Gammaproteobacteria bacterium]